MKQYYLVFIGLVVLVSGCTGPGDVFGSDVVKVGTSTVQDGTRDVLVVKDITTIPTSPMLPGKPVLLTFFMENNDQLKNIDNVKVELFDAPVFKSNTQPPVACNSQTRPCKPNVCAPATQQGPCIVRPTDQVPINFQLLAFDNTEIANIETKTRLSLKVNYDFQSSLFYQFPAVNQDEILRRQQSNDVLQLASSKSYSSGPVQIDAELQGQPFMLAGTPATPGFPATIGFTVKNAGSGNLVNSRIEKERMVVVFPPGINVARDRSGRTQNGVFACTGGRDFKTEYSAIIEVLFSRFTNSDILEQLNRQDLIPSNFLPDDSVTCINRFEDIELFKDKSQTSLNFDIDIDRSVTVDPYRTFEVKALAVYTYELRDGADITIKPYA